MDSLWGESLDVARKATRRYSTIEFSHGKEVVNALLQYAYDHDGEFPEHLEDVPLDTVPSEVRNFRDRKTKQEMKWLYFPGYDGQSPTQTIVLASPLTIDSYKRLAYFIDGSGQIMDEQKFERLLSEQLNRK